MGQGAASSGFLGPSTEAHNKRENWKRREQGQGGPEEELLQMQANELY